MPESAADPALNPYITPQEDRANAEKLKIGVAHQVYNDIRQEAEREGVTDDSALKKLFDRRSKSSLPDYQAVKIVDLEEKAIRDPLTGLLNRRGFETQFNQSLRESNQSGRPILLLIFDLDYFKNINDIYGHAVGDQALKYLARALTDSVDIGDLVGRWGGEEFIVAVKPKTGRPLDSGKLFLVVERIRRDAIDLLFKDKYQFKPGTAEETLPAENKITLSIGATLTRPGDTLEIVCQRADKYLYEAKDNGRDQSIGDNGKIVLTPASPPGAPPEIVSS